MSPLVSVIIPAYNSQDVVAEAVNSMLQQTVQGIEILVVDDASQDETLSALHQFTDPRIRIIEHARNLGAAHARNTGIHSARRGEFIAFLDADDVSLPYRLEKQIQYLNDHPEVGGVGSAATLFGSDEGAITPFFAPEDVAASTMFTCEFLMPSMTFRRSALESLDVFFRQEYGSNCDWELVARMVRYTPVANLPEALVRYRRWPQQMTSRIVDTMGCSATLLRSEMLEWFGIPKAEQDLAAHIMVSPCYWPVERRVGEAVGESRAAKWIDKIRRTNERYGRLDAASMEKVFSRCLTTEKTHANQIL